MLVLENMLVDEETAKAAGVSGGSGLSWFTEFTTGIAEIAATVIGVKSAFDGPGNNVNQPVAGNPNPAGGPSYPLVGQNVAQVALYAGGAVLVGVLGVVAIKALVK